VVDNLRYAVAAGTAITIRNTTRDDEYLARHRLSARRVAMVLAGGMIPWLRNQQPPSPR
jgi:aconitate hydratase